MLGIYSKKTYYNTKISKIGNKITADHDHDNTTDHDHDKYITTQEFNKLTEQIFASRLAQANLACKNDIASFLKKYRFCYILKKFK